MWRDERPCQARSEHREQLKRGFSRRYGLKMLVYYERHGTAYAAIQREKNIKHSTRAWKLDLVQSLNPQVARSLKILRVEIHHGLRGSSPRMTLSGEASLVPVGDR